MGNVTTPQIKPVHPEKFFDPTLTFDIDTTAIALDALRSVVQHSRGFDDAVPDMEYLVEQYKSGFVDREWEDTAKGVIKGVWDAFESSRIVNGVQSVDLVGFATKYNDAFINSAAVLDKIDCRVVDVPRTVTGPIEKEVQRVRTYEEAEILLGTLIETGLRRPNEMGDQVDHLQQVKNQIEYGLDDDSTAVSFKDDSLNEHKAHFLTAGDRSLLERVIRTVCDGLIKKFDDLAKKKEEFDRPGFQRALAEERKDYIAEAPEKRAKLEDVKYIADEADRYASIIPDIVNVAEKMRQESKGLHRDSKEYRAMRDAVMAVEEIAKKEGYDARDAESVKRMHEAIAEVNRAANVYAEKKVLDKTKATELGVERKNSALLLIHLTDPEMADLVALRVEDFRMSSGEDASKTKRSFKQLMEEERSANRQREKKPVGKHEHKPKRSKGTEKTAVNKGQ